MTSTGPALTRTAAGVVGESVAELGESPLWAEDAGLRWLDVPGRRLLTRSADGRERVVTLPVPVTAVELTDGAELLAVTETGFALLDPDRGGLTPLATALDGHARVSMNDGGIDPRGRAFAGSAVRDGSRLGRLFRLTGTEVTAVVAGLGMSNGIDWSPDGEVLYHVDSAAGTVTARAYRPETGELGAARLLRDVPARVGLPDGLTVDADGHPWVAIWGAGEVWRLDPATGATVAVVTVPTAYPTSCAFGGPDLRTLYVTTARYRGAVGGGRLYAAEPGVTGRRPHRYRRAETHRRAER